MDAERVGEPFAMQVERGKVDEFVAATRASAEQYAGERAVTPPTYLMCAHLWHGPDSDPRSGTSFERVLHGEQEFVFHGPPPRVGDELSAQLRVDRTYQKQGRRGGTMTFFETVTEFRDCSGRLVAETRDTMIETSRPTGAPQ